MDYAEDTARCTEDENTNDQEHSDPVQNEETTYEEVHVYLSQGRYPLEATKQEKCIIRKRAKNFSYWMAFSTTREREVLCGR